MVKAVDAKVSTTSGSGWVNDEDSSFDCGLGFRNLHSAICNRTIPFRATLPQKRASALGGLLNYALHDSLSCLVRVFWIS